MKKNQIIKLVNESVASLFTKEDVINLINKVEGNGLDFNELRDRVIAIVEDADTTEIEVSEYGDTSFTIRNGNEINIESVDFNAQTFLNAIIHDIGELFENIEADQEVVVEQ